MLESFWYTNIAIFLSLNNVLSRRGQSQVSRTCAQSLCFRTIKFVQIKSMSCACIRPQHVFLLAEAMYVNLYYDHKEIDCVWTFPFLAFSVLIEWKCLVREEKLIIWNKYIHVLYTNFWYIKQFVYSISFYDYSSYHA